AFGALLAGCQSFSPRAVEAPDPGGAALISPLAGSVIGDERFLRPAPLDRAAALLNRPDIALEPLDAVETDLLVRLRNEFSLPATDEDAFQRELEKFAEHPEYIERVLLRAERYLFHIAESLEERGMPADLALLPFVESAFDPFAYSHGRAAGLW